MLRVMREESVLEKTSDATHWLLKVRQPYFDLQANERQTKSGAGQYRRYRHSK